MVEGLRAGADFLAGGAAFFAGTGFLAVAPERPDAPCLLGGFLLVVELAARDERVVVLEFRVGEVLRDAMSGP